MCEGGGGGGLGEGGGAGGVCLWHFEGRWCVMWWWRDCEGVLVGEVTKGRLGDLRFGYSRWGAGYGSW